MYEGSIRFLKLPNYYNFVEGLYKSKGHKHVKVLRPPKRKKKKKLVNKCRVQDDRKDSF